jgi:hypothetical protein
MFQNRLQVVLFLVQYVGQQHSLMLNRYHLQLHHVEKRVYRLPIVFRC